jgi:NAD+ synthase
VELKRRGLVLGVSGGIDSSVTLALAVRAVGKEKVLVLQMPERHSAEETLYLSGLVADHFGAEKIHEDISGILDAVGFYRRYADAVRTVIPEYTECWKSKIVLPNILESKSYSLFFDNSSIS